MASDSSKAELSEAMDSMIEEVRLPGQIQTSFLMYYQGQTLCSSHGKSLRNLERLLVF